MRKEILRTLLIEKVDPSSKGELRSETIRKGSLKQLPWLRLIIDLDVESRTISLDISEDEMIKRTKDLPERKNLYARGYTKLYINHVTQADKGCDFDFLEGDHHIPEPEIF